MVHVVYGRNRVLRALQAIGRIRAVGLGVVEVVSSDPESFAIIYAGKRYDDVNSLLSVARPDRAVVRVEG